LGRIISGCGENWRGTVTRLDSFMALEERHQRLLRDYAELHLKYRAALVALSQVMHEQMDKRAEAYVFMVPVKEK
jgi:hypothetical protein